MIRPFYAWVFIYASCYKSVSGNLGSTASDDVAIGINIPIHHGIVFHLKAAVAHLNAVEKLDFVG